MKALNVFFLIILFLAFSIKGKAQIQVLINGKLTAFTQRIVVAAKDTITIEYKFAGIAPSSSEKLKIKACSVVYREHGNQQQVQQQSPLPGNDHYQTKELKGETKDNGLRFKFVVSEYNHCPNSNFKVTVYNKDIKFFRNN